MNLGKLGQAQAAQGIFDLVQNDLEQVEKKISAESVASVDAVTAIGRYLQSAGGKRLRPALLLMSAKLVGHGNAGPSAIQMAAVVELLHAATLVHDDVIDAAETRRGRPSSNVKWGNHTCVLAGDWLYMQAFQIALRERNFLILDLLIGLTQMMVEGELLQLERIGRIDITEADCMELVDRKTARLFSVCARLGAVSAHSDAQAQEKLGEFAWNLGMAFQLIDDVLDFTARENVLASRWVAIYARAKSPCRWFTRSRALHPPNAGWWKRCWNNGITSACRSRRSWHWWSATTASTGFASAPRRSPNGRGR